MLYIINYTKIIKNRIYIGILTKYQVKDRFMPYVAIASPILCYLMDFVGKEYLGFGFGFTILIANGLLTFMGMFLFREKSK